VSICNIAANRLKERMHQVLHTRGCLNLSSLKDVLRIKRRYENDLLRRRLAVGCSIGYKRTKGKISEELSIIVYVYPKQDEPTEESIPHEIEGVKTDVQESRPFGAYAACTFDVASGPEPLTCTRLECMNRQKETILTQGLVNKIDFAYVRIVDRKDIIHVAKKTRLFLSELREQLEYDRRYGEPFRESGSSVGRYHFPIDQIYPGARKFMEELKRHVDSKKRGRSKFYGVSSNQQDVRLIRSEIAGLGRSTRRIIDPRLGMAVTMSGAASGVTEGIIVGIDASLFIDYPPWMSGEGSRQSLEPIFSPMIGENGARFPLDILGFAGGGIPIRFPPEPEDCPLAKSRKVVHPKRALFSGQIVTTRMAKKGDSGAPLYDKQMNPVGMLFAGSESFTYFHPMKTVLNELSRFQSRT